MHRSGIADPATVGVGLSHDRANFVHWRNRRPPAVSWTLRMLLAVVLLAWLTVLTACGGGGGGDGESNKPAPVISTQPADATVAVGGSATFSVAASVTEGTLSYQWRLNGVAIDTDAARLASYSVNNAQAIASGSRFDVVVSANGNSVNSRVATLTVQTVSLEISTAPQSVSVQSGQTASFSVAATGPGTLSYQWQRDGVAISGATQSSYSFTTALADSGSAFSVVVTSSTGGNLTSDTATLTVTSAPTSAAARWLIGAWGPSATGSLTLADGEVTSSSQAFGVVDAQSPGAPTQLVAAGGALETLALPQFTLSNGEFSNWAYRYFLLFGTDGRLMRSDLTSANAAQLTQVSTLNASEICSDGVFQRTLISSGNAALYWTLHRTPGADNNCGTHDDRWLAVRADMSSSATPVTLEANEVYETIDTATQALTGAIRRRGSLIEKLDAQLQNPETLHTVNASDFVDYGSDERFWFFRHSGTVWAISLSAPHSLISVTTEQGSVEYASSLNETYVGVGNTRIFKIGTGGVTELPSSPVAVGQLFLTDNHLVVRGSSSGLYSLPLSGGTNWTRLSSLEHSSVDWSGDTLWTEDTFGSDNNQVRIIQADGSGTQTLYHVHPVIHVLSASTPGAAAGVLTASGPSVTMSSQTGATLELRDARTGAVLKTYGTLPGSPAGAVGSPWFAGDGQNLLLNYINVADHSGSDLFALDPGASGGGLTRLTNTLVTTAGASTRTGKQAQAFQPVLSNRQKAMDAAVAKAMKRLSH